MIKRVIGLAVLALLIAGVVVAGGWSITYLSSNIDGDVQTWYYTVSGDGDDEDEVSAMIVIEGCYTDVYCEVNVEPLEEDGVPLSGCAGVNCPPPPCTVEYDDGLDIYRIVWSLDFDDVEEIIVSYITRHSDPRKGVVYWQMWNEGGVGLANGPTEGAVCSPNNITLKSLDASGSFLSDLFSAIVVGIVAVAAVVVVANWYRRRSRR